MSRKSNLLLQFGLFILIGILASIFFKQYKDKPAPKLPTTKLGKISETQPDAVGTYPGYNLIPLTGSQSVVLTNLNNKILHKWDVDATRARLLPNCNLMVVHGSKWGMNEEPWKTLRKTIREYSWEGKILWEYTASDIIHHDVQVLENGNVIFPYRIFVPAEFKTKITDSNRQKLKIRSDGIREVNKNGETVWEWLAHEHLDLNRCGRRPCTVHSGKAEANKKMSDWTHINTVSIIPENKWYDAGDKRFKPGNIITIPRNWWTALIIDKESKKVIWEYEGDYRDGLSGGHEAHMIPKGMPGEGNILIFDNGRIYHKNESFILEINPTNNELVWVYDNGKNFFSNSAGSMQRLPNGNTLISEDVGQKLFEINPNKEIIWEYKSQYRLSRSKRYEKNYCSKFANF